MFYLHKINWYNRLFKKPFFTIVSNIGILKKWLGEKNLSVIKLRIDWFEII